MGMEQPQSSGERPANRTLRFACLVIAAITGALAAWCSRTTMYPDGISYLDIGDAYWRHDWHNALNAYWSPLYSWILGLFISVIKPSPHWEYPLVHAVNFLIYAWTLVCFEYFLSTLIRQLVAGVPIVDNGLLPDFFWRVLGYSSFAVTSLVL